MKLINSMLIGSMIAVTLFSCNKKDSNSNNPNPPGATIVGTWKTVAMESDKEVELGIGMTKNIFLAIHPCQQDNLETYTSKTSGTRTQDEGATKCEPGDPQTIGVVPYTISGDTIHFGANAYFKILSVDQTTLKYSFPSTWKQGNDSFQIVITSTLQRQ